MPTASAPIRLGAVSYLNTLPLIEGLGKLDEARLTLTAPARLIDLLQDDEADIALASIIDFQRSTVPLAIIPVGMIGSDGPTLTVRLFSRVPLADVTTIHADVDSHTSITLARIIVHASTGRVPDIAPFDADQHRALLANAPDTPGPETILLIGDKVVTDAPAADRYHHTLDLGQAWKQHTGLPFTYAAWMCKEDNASDPAIAAAAAFLDRTRRHNATRLDWIAAARAPARDWPLDLARPYLDTNLRFDLNEAHRASIDRFFDEAHALGLIPARRPTHWLS